MISAWCVACDLYTIVPWPLEHTCRRQWGDCTKKSQIAPFNAIMIIILLLLSHSTLLVALPAHLESKQENTKFLLMGSPQVQFFTAVLQEKSLICPAIGSPLCLISTVLLAIGHMLWLGMKVKIQLWQTHNVNAEFYCHIVLVDSCFVCSHLRKYVFVIQYCHGNFKTAGIVILSDFVSGMPICNKLVEISTDNWRFV